MSESGFNSAGAFSGGDAGGLKGGIAAAMQVMGQNNNIQNLLHFLLCLDHHSPI